MKIKDSILQLKLAIRHYVMRCSQIKYSQCNIMEIMSRDVVSQKNKLTGTANSVRKAGKARSVSFKK